MRIVPLLLGLTVASSPSLAAQQAPRTLTLADPTGRIAQPFGMVNGVRELSDGSLLIADPTDAVLRRVDPAMHVVTILGRQGSGPGEYVQPDHTWPLPNDSTLLVDLGNNRLVRLGQAGGFGAVQPILAEGAGGRPSILNIGGTDREGALFSAGAPEGDSITITRIPPGGGRATVVAKLRGPEVNTTSSGGPGNRNERSAPVPLSPQDGWAVTVSGLVYLVRASDYHVDVITPMGDVHHGDRVVYAPIRITDAEREAYLEERRRQGGVSATVQNTNGEMTFALKRGPVPADAFANVTWPEVKPAFSSGDIWVDSIDRLWVRRHTAAGSAFTYDIFLPNGNRTATIQLGASRRIVGMGEHTVYLARNDDDDLLYLERYALPI
ncbi:MAG: hypothetical protein ABI542_10285 [Gemmatimonadota bacterium]